MEVLAHVGDFGAIFDFPGIQKSTLGATIFGPEGSKGVVLFPGRGDLEPTWAQFGAETAPKASKNRFLSILDGFWTDFGWIYDDFG